MTEPTDLAAALLADVPRYWQASNRTMQPATDGDWLSRADVLAALSRALDPALAERVGEVVEALRYAADRAAYEPHRHHTAADLITALLAQNAALRAERDALAAELHTMKTAGIIEVAVRNPSVADYVQHWEGRTEAAEAERDALRAERDELVAEVKQADTMLVAEANASLERLARAEAAEAQIAALSAKVEGLTGAVWLKVGECLAGMTHREVSQEARARIKRALDAALSAITEERK